MVNSIVRSLKTLEKKRSDAGRTYWGEDKIREYNIDLDEFPLEFRRPLDR